MNAEHALGMFACGILAICIVAMLVLIPVIAIDNYLHAPELTPQICAYYAINPCVP